MIEEPERERNMNTKKEKSVLDNMPVDDVSYKEVFSKNYRKNSVKGIVGHCPSCGSPIYGPSICGSEKPDITYVCECKQLAFDGLIHTK